MAKKITTCDLINTSLRRAMIPSDQSTFTCSDIIDIMNEELGIHVLPVVLRAHEEYYVVDEDQSLSACTIRYKIPYRATGNKLRDVQFIDNAGTQYEMTRVSLEDRPEYQGNYTNNQFLTFYLEGTNVVLMQNQISNGSLRMSYYLRPNDLVLNKRAGKIKSITNQFGCVTISSYADLVCACCADVVRVAGVTFTAQTAAVTLGDATFQAATSNTATASSLVAQINAHTTASGLVTATSLCGVVTATADAVGTCLSISYSCNTCTVGSTVSNIKKQFEVASFPSHFTCATSCCVCVAFCFDFVSGKSPNSIPGFDREASSVCSTNKTVTFDMSELKTVDLFSITPKNLTLEIGDYIMKENETIVPQLPTELFPILAQRTAVKMLEALGDFEGMKAAQNELERMEYNAQSLIDNRVEGSPQKIANRHSILKSSLSNKLYRRRGL